MSDYSSSKGIPGAIFPNHATEAANASKEPLITASQLRQRFLFGLPLVSQIKDPITGKPQQVTDSMINDIINSSVAQIETEFKIDIFPVQRKQKYPFDRSEYDSWGFFQLNHTPIASIDKLTITPANEIDVYEIPKDWIETNNIIYGQVNIIPIGIGSVYQGLISSTPASGAWFLSVLQFTNWLPAYWNFTFTTGFPDGQVPRVINDMIGCSASIQILGMLGTTYAKSTSSSLGIDGMSHSIATPGGNIFNTRIEMLEQRYQMLGKKLKSLYQQKIWSSTI